MKVVILANSLAYYDYENRWYDVEDIAPGDMYPRLLGTKLGHDSVKVISFPWMTIRDAVEIVARSVPQVVDVFVLHVGIVECVRRIYPVGWRRAVNSLHSRRLKDWLNDFETVLLRLPVNLDGWISPNDFGHMLRRLCSDIQTRFEPSLLLPITINSVNENFETKHPGTNKSVSLHNQQIFKVGAEFGCKIMPANELLDNRFFLSDGIHLNREGHRFLACGIVDSIQNSAIRLGSR